MSASACRMIGSEEASPAIESLTESRVESEIEAMMEEPQGQGLQQVGQELRQIVDEIETWEADFYREMRIREFVEVKVGQVHSLDSTFSGRVYLMAPKETLKELQSLSARLNGEIFEDKGGDEFNVRYHGKTYFTVQSLQVEDLKALDFQADWDSPVFLVLQAKE